MIIARDRRQARVIKRFVGGLLQAVPMLRQVIVSETAEGIVLRNRVVIEIHTASFRAIRGYTIVALVRRDRFLAERRGRAADPIRSAKRACVPDGDDPRRDVAVRIEPLRATGRAWDAHRKHFGKDGDPILVWQATTRDMNATCRSA